jgi:hypothetical protein
MASKEHRAEAIEQFATALAAFATDTASALAELKGQIEGMCDSGQIDVEDYRAYEPEFDRAEGTVQAALRDFSESQAGRLHGLAEQIRNAAY